MRAHGRLARRHGRRNKKKGTNMRKPSLTVVKGFGVLGMGLLAGTLLAHHSFAMYDMTKTVTFTGVLTRFVSQANHAELHFVPLGPDGKPTKGADGEYVSWGVE